MKSSIALLALVCGCVVVSSAERQPSNIQVYFSPRGGCTAAILGSLRKATNWERHYEHSVVYERTASAEQPRQPPARPRAGPRPRAKGR